MTRNGKLIVNCQLCNDACVIHFDANKRSVTLPEGWNWYSERPDKSAPTWTFLFRCWRHSDKPLVKNTQSTEAKPCSKA